MTFRNSFEWDASQSQSLLDELDKEDMRSDKGVDSSTVKHGRETQNQVQIQHGSQDSMLPATISDFLVRDLPSESDDSESESEFETEAPKKKRKFVNGKEVPKKKVPGPGRRGADHRRAYTDKEYQMIINAPNNQHRKIIAQAINMPWKTALNIMRRYRLTGNAHDTRKDANRTKVFSPYDNEHRGSWGKLSPKYVAYAEHLIHFNCVQTNKELLVLINREIIRDFLLSCEVAPENAAQAATAAMVASLVTGASEPVDATKHGIVLGIRPLLPEERDIGGPLDTKTFENNQAFKEFCDKYTIKSDATIGNHLRNKLYTRKNTIFEKATANTPQAKLKRFQFANVLRDLCDGNLGKVFLIFQDEMPVYLHQSRSKGRAKKGKRAVVKDVPTSRFSFRTQVAMAVHPNLGLFTWKQFNPVKKTTKDGKPKKPSWGSSFGKKEFEEFLHLVLSNIIVGFTKPEVAHLLQGSKIYLIIDNAPEHGKNSVLSMVQRFPAKAEFDRLLQEHGASFHSLKLPPNSPQLNLCEYYNMNLRQYINHERADPEVQKLMTTCQADEDAEVGRIVENRVQAIHDCIDKGFRKLQDNPKAQACYKNFVSWVHRVIQDRGKINFSEPY